jgi:Domain of unknown function (DUF4190)
MSISSGGGTPGNGGFTLFPPGPHSGIDPNTRLAGSDSMDSRARTALSLGLLSFLFAFVTGIPAIWYGRKALLHISASEVALKGRWAAWTGIVLGSLSVVATLAVWFYLHQNG